MVVFMRDQQLIDAALEARLRAVLLELMKMLTRRAAFFQRRPTAR